MQLPKKAIITVAGIGTRFLPATKAVPKEMLPIIDRPVVQYIVEELIESGIRDIIIVVRQGAKATEEHFGVNRDLERQLKEAGKKDKLRQVRSLSKMAKFTFIEQTQKMPYGNATPLKISASLVKDRPFLYLFGDDITIAKIPVCKQLIETYKKERDAEGVVGVRRVPKKEVVRYGTIKIKKGTGNVIEDMVEKPTVSQAPSNIVQDGRFLLTPKILPIINRLKRGKDNELWLIDAVLELAQKNKVVVHEIEGKWLTTGDPLNYLKAMVELAWQRDDLREGFKKYVVGKLKK